MSSEIVITLSSVILDQTVILSEAKDLRQIYPSPMNCHGFYHVFVETMQLY
jgi:hypothetical protein